MDIKDGMYIILAIILLFGCRKETVNNIIPEKTMPYLEYNETTDNKDVFIENIKIDININENLKSSPEILQKTDGMRQNDTFKIKNIFDQPRPPDNIFMASSLDELNVLKEKYFDYSYLDTFSHNFFEDNYLAIVLEIYGAGHDFRNERIEINDNKYSFEMEYWHLATPEEGGWVMTLIFTIYVLKIPK
jgi:hypothetical protein